MFRNSTNPAISANRIIKIQWQNVIWLRQINLIIFSQYVVHLLNTMIKNKPSKSPTIESFYEGFLNIKSGNLRKELGHFTVFNLKDYDLYRDNYIPFSRKEYLKICYVKGKSTIHHQKGSEHLHGENIIFLNSLIPYSWEHIEKPEGFSCVFTLDFFNQFGKIEDYPIFNTSQIPIFKLDKTEVTHIKNIYERMLVEINSDYEYKYDVLKSLILWLIHMSMRNHMDVLTKNKFSRASQRISNAFLELLEEQFPIVEPNQRIRLRTASDYAHKLSIHVNHLNKAIQDYLNKSTTEIILERMGIEAKRLLNHTNWSISEVGYCLGFEEPSNFSSFFKKITNKSPRQFRMV